MRYFVCLLDPVGVGLPDAVRHPYESLPRRRGLDFVWHQFPRATVLTAWDDPWGDSLIEEDGAHLAVGMVRLDNREDVERWANAPGHRLTDLQLVLQVVARHGTRYIPNILGDFAFVVWHAPTGTLTAATDGFAVKKLYYAGRRGRLLFASRAESLALDDCYDVQFLAELVAGCMLSPGLTPYAGVRHLPAGTLAVSELGKLTTHKYWEPQQLDIDSGWVTREQEAAEACRELLAESVRRRLGPPGTTWAQLSGGLDSSSIVGVAQ